jgi:hypothetical protein
VAVAGEIVDERACQRVKMVSVIRPAICATARFAFRKAVEFIEEGKRTDISLWTLGVRLCSGTIKYESKR